jgi:hypothetical protein
MTTLGKDKHAAGAAPGPTCTVGGSGRGRVPGPLCGSKQAANGHAAKDPTEEPRKKAQYLDYARSVSYLMEAKSVEQSTEKWLHVRPARIQSDLGGPFLRMYLKGQKDPKLIAEAGKEIGADDQFHDLVKELTRFLQTQADQGRFSSDQTDRIKAIADAHLKAIRKSRGIDFRRNLNTVIGGVGGIAVDAVTRDAAAGAGLGIAYQVKIHISDTYHFNNHREGDQDRYRKLLSQLLSARDFDKFEETYDAEATLGLDSLPHPFLGRKWQSLDDATIFASFMYALEMNGWTPGGLDWDVVVPAPVTLVFKAPQKTPQKTPEKTHGH